MSRILSTTAPLLAAALALNLTACGESGSSDSGSLEGELITLVVGTSPGGGYDSYARLLAPHLSEELGADVTVENMTGAGGLLAVNNTYVADPDGTTLHLMNGSGTLGSVLSEADGIEFELGEFSYLGRIAGEPRVFSITPDLPYEEAEELIGTEDEFTFAATGVGGSQYLDGALGMASFDMQNSDFITGFDGSEEASLAVTAGEADGIYTTADTVIPSIEAGDQRALAVVAEERVEELEDVPTVTELDLDDTQMEIAQSQVQLVEAGRMLVAPPEMPEETHTELTEALETVVNSPELEKEAKDQNLPINFLDSKESQKVMDTALDSPDSVREALAAAEE